MEQHYCHNLIILVMAHNAAREITALLLNGCMCAEVNASSYRDADTHVIVQHCNVW